MKLSLGLAATLAASLSGACGGVAAIEIDSNDGGDASREASGADGGEPVPGSDASFTGAVQTVRCPWGLDDGGSPDADRSYDKSCASASDCTFGIHYLDCCGTAIALGINGGEAFAWGKTGCDPGGFPACDCVARGLLAEDGHASRDPEHSTDVAVFCLGGACKTAIVRDGP